MCMVETQCERNVHNEEYGEQTDRRSGRQSIATSRDVRHDEKPAPSYCQQDIGKCALS